MTFKQYSEKSRDLIKENLLHFCNEKKKQELPKIFKDQGLIDALESFAIRGKLIRGTLFLLISEALGRSINKELLDMACAIELMHSALLIQDDIIDNDYIRRGDKTIFAKYEGDGKKIGAFDSYHYGISSAIVVADIAYFFAVELLSSYENPQLSKLLKFYSHEVYLVVLAESADSVFGQTNMEPSKEDIYSVYKYKTARYTFSLPFGMAAIVSQTKVETCNILDKLGELSGIIFQLKDDEIGLFGEEETIGKPVGSDIRENKKTIIRFLLYKHANGKDKKILDRCFGNAKSGKRELELVREIYEKNEIHTYINEEIGIIMKEVWELFKKLEIRNEFKQILKELLEFNLSRSS